MPTPAATGEGRLRAFLVIIALSMLSWAIFVAIGFAVWAAL